MEQIKQVTLNYVENSTEKASNEEQLNWSLTYKRNPLPLGRG